MEIVGRVRRQRKRRRRRLSSDPKSVSGVLTGTFVPPKVRS